MLKEVTHNAITFDPFALYRDRWALLTAGAAGDFNTMTISWGSFGELWSKPVATVYSRHTRYTTEFLNREDYFTITFFPEKYHGILSRLGTLSGRDIDKINDSGLTPWYTDGTVAFGEADLVLICRKLYVHDFVPEEFVVPEVDQKNYSSRDYHNVYIGEIVKVYADI